MNDITLSPELLALVPFVVGLLQLIKRFSFAETIKPFIPFVAIAISCGYCYVQQIPDPVVSGLLLGMVASGGYDAAKGLTGGLAK